MLEPVHFHADLYRRDALEVAAAKYRGLASVELVESGSQIVARLKPLVPIAEEDLQVLCDEFCTEALSATVSKLRHLAANDSATQAHIPAAPTAPPWQFLAPFVEGGALGLGWVLDSLSPIRAGAAIMGLRHAHHGLARVAIHRNNGAPRGVAHTAQLDFMLMNDGGGTAQTEDSIATVLTGLADTLCSNEAGVSTDDLLAALLPHSETAMRTPADAAAGRFAGPRRVAPGIDVEAGIISFEIEEAGVSRLALCDQLLAFADRCHVFLTRPDPHRVTLQLKARGEASSDVLKALARDLTKALNQVVRGAAGRSGSDAAEHRTGLPPLQRRRVDIEALLADLEAADPATIGLGFQPERGPGHKNLRVMNILGTGACDSDCVFCVEKFDPTHRRRPQVDALRQMIADSAGNFDMLFFASGEPTIHPQLFEHVELAKSVGFSCFGMSSHFRAFADPRFTLKVLQAGFEYFDIALHAADTAAQLEVNPIGDSGRSLFEALKGLAVLLRLADVLSIRISVTHKIVISRLNVLHLEPIFHTTYDRGVRHFILQPVRTLSLHPDLRSRLEITEEEILPHLNELLRRTEGLGATIKPYGFSRLKLYAGSHVEHEQNRVKNMYGKIQRPAYFPWLPSIQEERPTDGRHWVELQLLPEGRFSFASDGTAPVLDGALERGLELPFGCRMGSCGICCAHLVDGHVDQSNQIFLTDDQVRQGLVLLCQARPLSDVAVKMCTEDELDEL